jgi:hypothetical protein
LSLAFAANTTAAEERGIENGGEERGRRSFWKTFRFPAERDPDGRHFHPVQVSSVAENRRRRRRRERGGGMLAI